MNADRKPQVEVFVGAASNSSAGESLPEVEIEASVSADEVRALEGARIELHVSGDDEVHRDHLSRRENLPHRLEPGAVYLDVRVRRRVAGRLAASEGEG